MPPQATLTPPSNHAHASSSHAHAPSSHAHARIQMFTIIMAFKQFPNKYKHLFRYVDPSAYNDYLPQISLHISYSTYSVLYSNSLVRHHNSFTTTLYSRIPGPRYLSRACSLSSSNPVQTARHNSNNECNKLLVVPHGFGAFFLGRAYHTVTILYV